jgi:hypothetical protein
MDGRTEAGRTDGSVTISLRNFTSEGIIKLVFAASPLSM